MNNRSHFSKINARKKPAGRHIPKMLAQYRKQCAIQQPKKCNNAVKDKLQDAQMYSVLLQMSTCAMQHISQVNVGQAVLLMLVLSPMLVEAMKTPMAIQNSIKVDSTNVQLLPSDAVCNSNTKGISGGMVCQFAGKTHYLKYIPYTMFDPKANDARHQVSTLSFEEFNRQFVSNNIGIRTPASRFFETKLNSNKHGYFIATEEVHGLRFVDYRENIENKLSKDDVIKLTVAKMFIRDLHNSNFGYDKDGLIIIDADSVHMVPESIDDYLQMEATARNSIKLNIYYVRRIVKLLEKMRETPLPDYHEQFGLTKDLYLNLLDIYINAYSKSIDFMRMNDFISIKTNFPKLTLDQQDQLIKGELTKRIDEAKNKLPRKHHNTIKALDG